MSADHVVHLGCGIEGMRGLADRSVDHVICDPPYEAEAHCLQVLRAKGPGHGRSIAVPAPLDFGSITEPERVSAAEQMARVSRRWVVVFCQAEAVLLWKRALEDGGAAYRRACVWVKPDGMPQMTGDRPGMGYESIVCAHAKGRSRWNGGGRVGVYTVLRFQGAEPNPHPTTKPLALMEQLVRDFTDPGELVLDPFSGSCTTGVACKRLGRRFIGWEKDARYFEIGRKRLDAAREQLSLLESRAAVPKQITMGDL